MATYQEQQELLNDMAVHELCWLITDLYHDKVPVGYEKRGMAFRKAVAISLDVENVGIELQFRLHNTSIS